MSDATRLQVFFSIPKVELHLIPAGGDVGAKTRIVSLPRNSDLGDTDPNVQLLRAMEAAGNEKIAALADLDLAPRFFIPAEHA